MLRNNAGITTNDHNFEEGPAYWSIYMNSSILRSLFSVLKFIMKILDITSHYIKLLLVTSCNVI